MIKDNMWDLLSSMQPETATDESSLYRRHDPFYAQKIVVRTDISGYSRHDFFANLCKGKRVLHIGCTDYPFVSVTGSLHLHIEKYTKSLDGFDIDNKGLEILRPHTSGKMFSLWQDVVDGYDLILAPEVIEHVDNVGGFLRNINSINCQNLLVTAPDAYSCFHGHFEYIEKNKTFIEIVHKDHNCWYSPFTLKNTIEKYSDYKVNSSWFFYGRSILAFATKD